MLAVFIDETGVSFFDESLVTHAVPTNNKRGPIKRCGTQCKLHDAPSLMLVLVDTAAGNAALPNVFNRRFVPWLRCSDPVVEGNVGLLHKDAESERYLKENKQWLRTFQPSPK